MSVNSEEGMTAVSGDHHEIARKSMQKILQRTQIPGSQQKAAKDLGISESQVSRMKNEQAATFCEFLAALGLRVEFDHYVSVDPKALEQSAAVFGRLLDHKDGPFILFGADRPSMPPAQAQAA